MTRRRLLAEVDSEELSEWLAFDEVHGLPDDRADYSRALGAAHVVNCWRGKGDPPLKLVDFVPDFGPAAGGKPDAARPRGGQTPQQQAMLLKGIALGLARMQAEKRKGRG